MRSASLAASGAVDAVNTAKGTVRIPASSAPYPRTNWKYCVTTNTNPKRAKKANVTATLPAVKRRLVNTETSSIGWSMRRSHHTNPASREAASPKRNARRRQPAVRRAFDDGPHEHGDAGDRGQRSNWIESGDGGVARRRRTRDGDQRDRDDRHVDHEHGPPPEVLEQPAACHRTECHGDARRGGPDSDGDRPLLGRPEDVDEDGQGRREHQRRTDAHQCAR